MDQVGVRGVAESPLNLSTLSRHQSTAYGADGSGVAQVRRSSVDFAQVCGPWLPTTTASHSASEPVAGKHCGDDLQHSRRSSYACEPQASHSTTEWLEELRNGSSGDAERGQSSQSTSLSSVSSVAWQAGVDTLRRPSADDLQAVSAADQLAGDEPHVHCGLPLKVRRKLGSASSSRITVDDAPRPQCDGVTLARRQLWSEDHRSTPSVSMSSGMQCSVSTEWFPSATADQGRHGGMSNFDALDQRRDRYE